MLLTAVIAVLAAIALGLMVIFGRLQRELAKSRDWTETEFLAQSLSRLLDPDEQHYLRARVPPKVFRTLHRKRMILAWRYAKRLRLDTAALARTTLASSPIAIELNDINVELLKVQLTAIVGYCLPQHSLAASRFSDHWRRFTEQVRRPAVGSES